jgi:hypothetical protein
MPIAKTAILPLLNVTLRKYVPGVKSAGGDAAGKLATILVGVAVCAVRVTPPNLIVGLDPKFVPEIVIVLFP